MEIRRVILFPGERRMQVLVKVPSRKNLIEIQYAWKVRTRPNVPPMNWVSTIEAEVSNVLAGRPDILFR